jgi:catechol 2,3-dioxygenase-like lactoylglutathione lyase family enzyme
MSKAKTEKPPLATRTFQLATCDVMTFVATRDASKSRRFYEETLGLRFISDEPYALVFDLNGIMLRIQKVQDLTPAQHTTLGWSVPNVREAVETLAARGVPFQRFPGMQHDELGVWTSPTGGQVAWFRDPDGNTLSLTQFVQP